MTKKQFRNYKKLLCQELPPQVRVRITYGLFNPERMGVSGSYSSRKQSIHIFCRGRNSYLSILACLAHEIRHAQHHAQGLFPEYYQPRLETKEYRQLVRAGLEIPPSIEVGQQAEDDCNLYARQILQQLGLTLSPTLRTFRGYFEPYPQYYIMTYALHQLRPRN